MVYVEKQNDNLVNRVFFSVFFVAMFLSIGLTYYHTIAREDYVIFTDPETVPDPSDVVAYVVSTAAQFVGKSI